MFQILSFVEAKLATVVHRNECHGEDDVPAVTLGLEITAANTLLDCIDPKIRGSLYMAVEGQDQLPGVEPSTPVLRCNSFDRHTLPAKYEGWTLSIDDGVDDTKPMTFGSCKVDKMSIDAKQGGTVILRLRVGTSDLDAARSGFLAMHVAQSVWITLTAPEKQPDVIDASKDAKDLPPDAGSLFAQSVTETGPDDGDEPDPDEAAWPFPENANAEQPPQSVTVEQSQPGTRTARGREQTAKALAAGKTH